MTELTITIPKAWWFSANDRLHWAARAARTRRIRTAAAWEAKRAGVPRHDVVHVCAWIGYPRPGKADPSNAAPVVKAALDGLTDAGVWEDDDHTHVVAVEYRRDKNTGRPGEWTVRLTITDQEVSGA